MSSVSVALPEVDAYAHATFKVDFVTPDQTVNPRFTQAYAGFAIDPYTIKAGFPVEDTGYGVKSTSSALLKAATTGAGTLTPSQVNTGSDARWLPTAASVSGGQWACVAGTPFPYIAFQNQQNLTTDPAYLSSYTYVHRRKRVSQPAVTFKGQGYGQLYTSGNNAAVVQTQTFLYVLVPHPGPGPFWSLFDTGAGQSSSTQLNVRYRKGAIQVYTGGTVESRQLEYECHLKPGEPIILVLAFDLPNSQVRFSVYDRRRTARTYEIANVTGIIPNTLLGMSVGLGGAADYSKAPTFEMLEFDIWNRALTYEEIEQVTSLLAGVFEVGQ